MKKEVDRIRRAYSDMLRETSPEAFEKTIINVRVRVKDSDSNFTKLMEMDKGRVIILNSML